MSQTKYKNGRSFFRSSDGRFASPTFEQLFGVRPNDRPYLCISCGEHWIPIVVTGASPVCPSCGNSLANLRL